MKQNNPFLIIISGPMGVGKTTVARLLHEKLERTALLSYDQIKWFVSDFNSDNADFQLTFRIEKVMIREYLTSGVSVILEKAFSEKELIDDLKFLAEELSASVFIYQLEAPLEVVKERINQRPPSSKRKIPPTADKIERSHARYLASKHDQAKIIKTEKMSSEEIVEEIIKDISEK